MYIQKKLLLCFFFCVCVIKYLTNDFKCYSSLLVPSNKKVSRGERIRVLKRKIKKQNYYLTVLLWKFNRHISNFYFLLSSDYFQLFFLGEKNLSRRFNGTIKEHPLSIYLCNILLMRKTLINRKFDLKVDLLKSSFHTSKKKKKCFKSLLAKELEKKAI